MSNPIGIVMGQFCTPFIVRKPEDVPLMNIIWFIPAGLGALLTIWKVIVFIIIQAFLYKEILPNINISKSMC